MSGTAAARTNNATGIASLCGDCSVLEINVSSCSNTDCVAHEDSACGYVAGWYSFIPRVLALSLPDPFVLRVLNLSVGSDNRWMGASTAADLWSAFKQNVVLVTSAGDKNTTTPRPHAPANLPFVLGVGGVTWYGAFWDSLNTCYDNKGHGTTVGYSEWAGSAGSGRSCSICAPASGSYVVAEPYYPDSTRYWFSMGMNSGACAQASGLAGLIQSLAHEEIHADLPADDVIGIIEATATPWPAGALDNVSCSQCPAYLFGNGILNADGATALVTDYLDRWAPGGNINACERWADRDGRWIQPGSWTFTRVDSATLRVANHDTTWVEWRAQARVRIPSFGDPPGGRDDVNLPSRVAWVRRDSVGVNWTNTYPSYSPYMDRRIEMMHKGIHDCRLGPIDQDTGLATITGYVYSYRDSVTQSLVFPVPQDSVRMAYVVMCAWSVGVETDERPVGTASTVFLARLASPASSPVRFRVAAEASGSANLNVVDVTGRQVRSLDLGMVKSGSDEFCWDGTDANGGPVPTGVYWFVVSMNGETTSRRFMFLQR